MFKIRIGEGKTSYTRGLVVEGLRRLLSGMYPRRLLVPGIATELSGDDVQDIDVLSKTTCRPLCVQ